MGHGSLYTLLLINYIYLFIAEDISDSGDDDEEMDVHE